jgi:hypothetical protein
VDTLWRRIAWAVGITALISAVSPVAAQELSRENTRRVEHLYEQAQRSELKLDVLGSEISPVVDTDPAGQPRFRTQVEVEEPLPTDANAAIARYFVGPPPGGGLPYRGVRGAPEMADAPRSPGAPAPSADIGAALKWLADKLKH